MRWLALLVALGCQSTPPADSTPPATLDDATVPLCWLDCRDRYAHCTQPPETVLCRDALIDCMAHCPREAE